MPESTPSAGDIPEGEASGPNEAPISQPQQPLGDEVVGSVNVHIAMEVLENTLPKFGSTSEKGQAILEVLRRLSKTFGGTDAQMKQLAPAEIEQLLHAAGGDMQPPAPPTPTSAGVPPQMFPPQQAPVPGAA